MFEDNLNLLSERLLTISEYNYYKLSEADDEAVDPNNVASNEDSEEEVQMPEDEETDDQSLADLENVDTQDDTTDVEQTNDGNTEEVEIDVTDIVSKQEALSQSIQDINQKLESALSNLKNMDSSISTLKTDMVNNLGTVVSNLETTKKDLEQEFKKRNPTPEEKLELRSMSSYPYNLKLSDYWTPTFQHSDSLKNVDANISKDSKYDISNKSEEEDEKEEYIIRKKDLMGFNDYDVKNSF